MTVNAIGPIGKALTKNETRQTLATALAGQFTGQRLLVLIPDHTRSCPLPFLFRTIVEVVHDAKQLDFMVALGTHPPLDEAQINRLVGIDAEERTTKYKHVGLLNHTWDQPSSLALIGVMEQDEIKQIAGENWHPSLPHEIEIRINNAALEYDHILVLGPTFPHEVVGFSGGEKYLFPGISGAEMINATHWLGALAGVVGTIGIKDTPVRAMIRRAASCLPTPCSLVALVVEGEGLSGIFLGDQHSAWEEAVDLSAARHIRRYEKPFQKVLSCAPTMYDELWTAAKAMYKLEPVVAKGGEVVIYAPHLDTISHVHGKYIDKIGYHILPYFLTDWEHFQDIPLGVLAHSTHVRGSGVMENVVEKPNVRVTLASRISPADCERLNLGYLDPGEINPDDWKDREGEGVLYVPKAGEILYRLE